MDLQALARHLEAPEVLQQLLGDYSGDCSVALGPDPQPPPGRVAVIIEVPTGAQLAAPTRIQLGSELLPVIVRHDHVRTRPLRT